MVAQKYESFCFLCNLAHRSDTMLLIFTPHITPRLTYITRLLFERLMEQKTELSSREEDFIAYDGPKFIYDAPEDLKGRFQHADIEFIPRMPSVGLLFSDRIEPVEHRLKLNTDWLHQPLDGKTVEFPFDLLSSAFYLITRYEEYLSFSADQHGRYPYTESAAWRYGFLTKPVVQLWMQLLVGWLHQHHAGISPQKPVYQYVPTLDIDHCYRFLGRSLMRGTGGMVRSLLQGNLREAVNRIQTVSGRASDPYDVYDFVHQLHCAAQVPTRWFLLAAAYGGDDNNMDPDHPLFSNLVTELSKWSEVGIHPSMASGMEASKLGAEIKRLEQITGKPVTHSRQHFLRFKLPQTYRDLIDAGITDDYSMGYAGHPGFRAGIAHPFPFFDLDQNRETALMVHPLAVMDVTLRDYLNLDPPDALERIKQMVEVVRLTGGTFMTLWHNESLSDYGHWRGWRDLYEKVVATASSPSEMLNQPLGV